MRKIPVIQIISASLTYFVLGFFVLLILFVLITAVSGLRLFSVVSPSMSPAIPVNSVIVVTARDLENIAPDDVITFRAQNGAYVTHRVIYANADRDVVITQGDANNVPDDSLTYGAVVGRVVFHLPNLGGIFRLARTPAGIAVLVMIPLAAVFLNGAAQRLCAKKYVRKENPEPS